MVPPVEVVKHDLNNEPCFPERVVDVLRTLDRPLPRNLARQSELLPTLPPGLHPLYQEALDSKDLVLEEDDDLDPPCRPVSDILGSVLTSVLTARSTRQCHHGRSERQRCWTSLLLACRVAMLESSEVFVSEDVAFALPRTASTLAQLQIEKFEGTAAAISYVRTDRVIYVPPEDSGGIEETTEEDCVWLTSKHDSYAEYDVTPADNNISHESRGFHASLHAPFDAHISPGRGRRVDCELPVICTADENEIQDLVTAVVCQRHVWGVATPVVGISLPQSGTYASVVVGWLEVNKTDSSGAAPVVHLASHWGVPPPTLPPGVFDVSDPTSALRFAQFILSLHPQFSSIKQSTRTAEPREFCWRLDHGGFDELLFNSDDSCLADYRVQAWVAEQASTNELVSSVPPDCRPSSSPPMSAQTRRTRSSATSPQSPDGHLTPPALDHTSKATQSPAASSVDKASKNSPYAASEFAGRVGKEFDSQALGTWMMERLSMSIANIETAPARTPLHRQINEMVEWYNKKTRLEWPQEWKNLDSLPPCDIVLTGLRNQLFADFETYEKSTKVQRMPPNADIFKSICGHMSTFLTVVASARQSGTNEKDGFTKECASRGAWDIIIKAACCPPDEILSNTFLVEQNIRLAGNRAKSEEDHDQVLRFAEATVLIASSHAAAAFAARRSLPSALPAITRGQYNRASQYHEYLNCTTRIYPLDREYEPRQAIMDGVFCLRYTCPQAAPTTEHDVQPQTVNKRSHIFEIFRKFFKRQQPKQSTSISNCKVAIAGPVASQKKTPSRSKSPKESKHTECLMCPEVQKTLGVPFSAPSEPFAPSGDQIFVPFIFAEYKRNSKPLRTAFNQMKLYCVTGIEFLASLGVTDWPVWGIITSGSEGVITMAWKSSGDAMPDLGEVGYEPDQAELKGVNVLFQYNLKQFNLAHPLEAYHFYTCVHRLYRRHKKLQKRLDQLPVVQRLRHPNFEHWMMPPIEEKSEDKPPKETK